MTYKVMANVTVNDILRHNNQIVASGIEDLDDAHRAMVNGTNRGFAACWVEIETEEKEAGKDPASSPEEHMNEFDATDFSKMTKNQILEWAAVRYIFPNSTARKEKIIKEIKTTIGIRKEFAAKKKEVSA